MEQPHGHSKKARPWEQIIVLTVLLVSTSAAAATPTKIQRAADEHYRQATAAFGLGNYAEAALQYEQAFALVPDHALLFNAALSHERAGNAERARTLFANYLRLFAKGEKAVDARRHLEQNPAKGESPPSTETESPAKVDPAAEEEAPVDKTPPAAAPDTSEMPTPAAVAGTQEPPSGGADASPIATVPAASPSVDPASPKSRPELLPPPSPGRSNDAQAVSPRPLWKNPWLWGAVAVTVGLAVAVGISLANSQSSQPPLWGRIQ